MRTVDKRSGKVGVELGRPRSLWAICLIGGLLAAISLTSFAARAAEVELTLITGFPFQGPAGDKMYGAKLFIERFNAKAKGQARIRVVGGPEVVGPFDQLKALQTGQFDAMLTTQAYFNEMRGLQFINFLTSDEQVKGTIKGYSTLQKISRESAGVTFVLVASPGLPFYLWTREAKPIANVADAKGLKVRGIPGLNEQMVAFLGSVPINLPSNEVYTGLRNGILDGAVRDSLSIEVLNEGEFAKNRTETRLADFSSELYVANKAWDALPDSVREIFNSVARETEKDTLVWLKERVERTNKLLDEKYHVKVVKGTPELNDIIGRQIGGALIKQVVDGTKYRSELIESYSLQTYLTN